MSFIEKIHRFVTDFVDFSLNIVKTTSFKQHIYQDIIENLFKYFYFDFCDFK